MTIVEPVTPQNTSVFKDVRLRGLHLTALKGESTGRRWVSIAESSCGALDPGNVGRSGDYRP